MPDHTEQLCQEDVEDEGQAVVDRVQVGTEPVQDSSKWSDVKEFDLERSQDRDFHLRTPIQQSETKKQ